MYKIKTPSVYYEDPWVMSFEQRKKKLQGGDLRIAYFFGDKINNSTFRYRIYNMIQVIDEFIDEYSASYFSGKEIDYLINSMDDFDILVICRAKYIQKYNQLITLARNKGKTVFFDIDDFLFDSDYVNLIVDTLDLGFHKANVWDIYFATTGRFAATMKLCDRFIATTEYLASRMVKVDEKPVDVIPNFMNKEQIDYSAQIFQEKVNNNFQRDDKIHIGYFSGSSSHNKDFDLISDALIELLHKYPNVILDVVGIVDIKANMDSIQSQIKMIPLQDFVNLQKLIGSIEINLIPLLINEFTNCKSELKFFEAGIVGTTSVASPVEPLKNVINNKTNGFLAKSFEWYDVLLERIEHVNDLPEIALQAQKDSQDKFAYFNQVEKIREMFSH